MVGLLFYMNEISGENHVCPHTIENELALDSFLFNSSWLIENTSLQVGQRRQKRYDAFVCPS